MKTINQRRSRRLECLVPIEGVETGTFGRARTVDISSGGVGVISGNKIPLNERIAVEVVLSSEEEPVLMLGEVKWINPVFKKGCYRIGMQFIKVLAARSKSRLDRYLKGPS